MKQLLKRNRNAEIKGSTIIILLLVAAFGTLMMGWWSLPQQQQVQPDAGQPPTAPGAPGAEVLSGNMKWVIENALTGADHGASATAYVDICKAENGVFDPLKANEKTEFDASPDTSKKIYASGDDLLFHVTSDKDATSGNETYPRWFYILNLADQAPIKECTFTCLQVSQMSPTYKYTINDVGATVGQVSWTGGDSPYWDLGAFALYPRVGKDYMIQQLSHKGTVMATLNDGASWEDTDGEINANVTFTTDKEDIFVELISEAVDLCWGLESMCVHTNGKIALYKSVIVFTTAGTGIGVSELTADGWKAINKADLYNDVGFYYEIDVARDGGIPAIGDTFSIRVPITVDDAGLASSTKYDIEAWVLDFQLPENVAIGSTSTSMPTSNGMCSEHGADAPIEPLALTVSSGSAATMQLLSHYTTN